MKTIFFQCSKNCGSQTRVTRLKVAPNIVDSISIKDADSRLKGDRQEIKSGLWLVVKRERHHSFISFTPPIRVPVYKTPHSFMTL